MPGPRAPHRIHLDVIGGLAGDMFVAAAIDAMPHLGLPLLTQLGKLKLPAGLRARLDETCAAGLKGLRFVVEGAEADAGVQPVTPTAHPHRSYREIRALLARSELAPPVKEIALALFSVLAHAEAGVHGIAVEAVSFHEVGAWDSIVDFVAAAFILDAVPCARWSWSPLPMGGGRVRCAHGVLPVPAPATARLLQGMRLVDDGVAGERVTPTGAAILRYLQDAGLADETAGRGQELLAASGIGHGTRVLPGLPNIVRCLVLEQAQPSRAAAGEIAALQFEVDDQTPEDLAVAIDHLRELPGVLEIYQAPLFGKKGRMAVQLQLLLQPWCVEDVANACFDETTTLGVRVSQVKRRTLPRVERSVPQDPAIRVKLARRPGATTTAKAEMDDLASRLGHREREQARDRAQALALAREEEDPWQA